jgi:hypothetical protein
MNLIVTSDFKIDGPAAAHEGFGRFTIPKGSRLLDVTGPDRYGYLAFWYSDSQLKGQIGNIQEHTEVER